MAELPEAPAGELLLYTTADGESRVVCRLADGSLWLTQAQLAALFQVSPQAITQHLRAIFAEGELAEDRTCKEYLQVQVEGSRRVSRQRKNYALPAVLAVGYRVRSPRGTQFRQWATSRLGEYLVKGFTMDDARLKAPPVEGSGVPDYFDELLARIRDIRASERRMYLRVRELWTLSGDYLPGAADTRRFFQKMQNKLHFAVTGQTAAELVTRRADHREPNMGLRTWQGERVLKTDVHTAKNYLEEAEIDELNRVVVMWLDYAEDQAKRRRQILLADWEERLDRFLAFNERPVLPHAGSVSQEAARLHAQAEYDRFAARRRALSEAEGQVAALEDLHAAARALSEAKDPLS